METRPIVVDTAVIIDFFPGLSPAANVFSELIPLEKVSFPLISFPQNDKERYMEAMTVKKEIETIVYQLIHKYGPSKIILFGSAARGEYDKVNDLDFLILKREVPSRGLDRMRELDNLIERNMAVDMLVYRPDELDERVKLGDPFIKTILSEGRILYG